MLLDYQVDPSSRQCFQTGRRLGPGERYFSVLLADGPRVVRRDYSVEAWKEVDPSWLGWWEATIPDRTGAARRLAPDEVLLNLLSHLENKPAEAELRYLVTLLLLRRRAVRQEGTHRDAQGRETIQIDCAARGEQYAVAVAEPAPECIEALQQRLAQLLDAGTSETS